MSREEVLVSVVMPSYNHAKYVGKAIESVLQQTHQKFELLIVDDGSTDNSAEVISGYDDPRITFIGYEQNTAFAGWEYMIANAKGKYIANIASDDMWEPELLEKYIDLLEEHEEYGCCFCTPHIMDENGDISLYAESSFQPGIRTKEQWFNLIYREGNCICAPSMCIRRTLYEEVGPYRFQYRQIQDYELWMRLLQVANIYVFSEKLMRYRFHPQGDNCNISLNTPQSVRRHLMEESYVKFDIMENMTDEYFMKAFADELILSPEDEGFCVECEKFCVMLNAPEVSHQATIFYFFRHYNDFKFKTHIEKYYNITRNVFWQYTGADFYGTEGLSRVKEENDQLKELIKKVNLEHTEIVEELKRENEQLRELLKKARKIIVEGAKK